MSKLFRIGTRGSALAQLQAREVAQALEATGKEIKTEIVVIKTSGDWKPSQGETKLSEAQGGKGLFAKEIEDALIGNKIDCGVHSAKDMPTFLPKGLRLDHYLSRVDVHDAFVSEKYDNLDVLPHGATVGTSSVRRQAFLLKARPDLNIVPIRGNVPTRLQKLKDGHADAIILAVAGLKRLRMDDQIKSIIKPDVMLPAAGQGAIAIEIRADDVGAEAILDSINNEETAICITAERAALAVLDGSCHTPIGAQADIDNSGVTHMRLAVLSQDGKVSFEESASAKIMDLDAATAMGEALGEKVKAQLPDGFLE